PRPGRQRCRTALPGSWRPRAQQLDQALVLAVRLAHRLADRRQAAVAAFVLARRGAVAASATRGRSGALPLRQSFAVRRVAAGQIGFGDPLLLGLAVAGFANLQGDGVVVYQD